MHEKTIFSAIQQISLVVVVVALACGAAVRLGAGGNPYPISFVRRLIDLSVSTIVAVACELFGSLLLSVVVVLFGACGILAQNGVGEGAIFLKLFFLFFFHVQPFLLSFFFGHGLVVPHRRTIHVVHVFVDLGRGVAPRGRASTLCFQRALFVCGVTTKITHRSVAVLVALFFTLDFGTNPHEARVVGAHAQVFFHVVGFDGVVLLRRQYFLFLGQRSACRQIIAATGGTVAHLAWPTALVAGINVCRFHAIKSGVPSGLVCLHEINFADQGRKFVGTTPIVGSGILAWGGAQCTPTHRFGRGRGRGSFTGGVLDETLS